MDFDFAAVPAHDFPADRQSQSGSDRLGSVGKGFERDALTRLRNAGTVVTDRNDHAGALTMRAQADLAAAGRMAQRVADQIVANPIYRVAADRQLRQVGLDIARPADLRFLGRRGKTLVYVAEHVG